MSTAWGSAFRDRARYEADRYGPDSWVFVRELLQNARDAGARRVWLSGVRSGGRDRVVCRDDGGGMSFDHARRYLFTLYASSKRGQSRSAGRFGIGFWSVLRFAPETVIVRSRPRTGEGWQVRLAGDLEHVKGEGAIMDPGTEIVLERRAGGPHPEKALHQAVLRDAPFLRCRGGKERPLEVLVNGRRVAVELDIEPPRMSFRRRGLHGVVALGREPSVQVFAHGLRVREAAFLDDLLLERVGRPPAAEGLAPRFILDSRDLSVMLARGDAREDRALRRLVAVGNRELNRLIRAELDRHAMLSLPARVMERLREAWSASLVPRLAVFAAAVAIGAGGSWYAVQTWSKARASPTSPTPVPVASQPAPQPYRDLAKRYSGPGVEPVAGQRSAIDLSYRPPAEKLFFAALRLTGLNGRGEADAAGAMGDVHLYPEAPCTAGCLEIELTVNAEAGLLRLPTATGHVLDAASVRFNGETMPVFLTADGEPVLRFDAPRTGRVRYRSAPGAVEGAVRERHWPALPPEAVGLALALDDLPIEDRVREALGFVRSRVVYDRSPAVIERYRAEREMGAGLFSRILAVGAGDCDVQNALLAAVLSRAGVSTRLAIGWIGVNGAVLPGLHAWTEYLDEDGRWRVIDASAGGPVVERSDSPERATKAAAPAGQATFLSVRQPFVVYAALLVLAAVAGALLVGRRAWQRSFASGGQSDMAELLRGAALRPQIFAQVRPLFRRKVVPLLSGRAVSLDGARAERHQGRLALGSDRSQMAIRASRKGRVVLDRDRAEGLAVGEALGAIDLDWWQNLLDAARTDQLAARVEKAFEGCGERVHVRVAANVGEATAVLDGSRLGLGRRSRWVVVDEGSELWSALKIHAERSPNLAALILADAVAPRLGLAVDTIGRCLGGLAVAVLQEGAEGGP